jgi:peptidoglycan/xylan/chitin deacetylase (PgdA/CDA1 family)
MMGRSAARRTLTWMARRYSGPIGSVVAVRTTRPHVVVTFDDGPEAGGTDRVLAALAERGATATFFVLLSKVRRHGGLLDEVIAAGHEIGLHGVDHRALPEFRTAEIIQRTRAGKAELEDRTGEVVRWFRPPYGRQTPRTWGAVTAAGLLPVMWGPSTWDWKEATHEERLASAIRGAAPGVILLAHDGFPGPGDGVDDGPAPVLDRGLLMGRVLDAYAERGLHARSLRDALAEGELVRVARFRR